LETHDEKSRKRKRVSEFRQRKDGMLRVRGLSALALVGISAALGAEAVAAGELPGRGAALIAELDRSALEAHKDAYSQAVGTQLKAELQLELKQSLRPRLELVSIEGGTRG
jgi:hypothetical protein